MIKEFFVTLETRLIASLHAKNVVGMFELKKLSAQAVPGALERAVRYRLLNDPWQAESICRDIISVDPDNQDALITLILSITDQFTGKFKTKPAVVFDLISGLKNEYQRHYYKGLIYERLATAALTRANPRSGYIAYEYLMKAMSCYDDAEKSHPEGNEESVLRWNACIRLMNRHRLEPAPEEKGRQPFLDV